MAGAVRAHVRGGMEEFSWEDINLCEMMSYENINRKYYSDLRSKKKILTKVKTRLNALLEEIFECKAELKIAQKTHNTEDIISYKGYIFYYGSEVYKIIDLLIDMGEDEYVKDILNHRKEVI